MEAALISAAVAAFVTLGIEYLAKPRLDARRERILDGHRTARAARGALGRLAFEVGRYEVWEGESAPWEARLDEIVGLARAEVDRLLALMFQPDPQLSELKLDAVELVAKFGDIWTAGARAGASQERLFAWVSGGLGEAVDLAEDILDLPAWRWRRRRELAVRLETLQAGPHRDAGAPGP